MSGQRSGEDQPDYMTDPGTGLLADSAIKTFSGRHLMCSQGPRADIPGCWQIYKHADGCQFKSEDHCTIKDPRSAEATPQLVTREHHLKCWPFPFEDMKAGRKPFEYRKNDRDYRVDDILLLEKFEPNDGRFMGEFLYRRVIYVLPGGTFGVPEGYCVMGVEPVELQMLPGRSK